MKGKGTRAILLVLAVALAAIVFAVDSIARFDIAVSILYLGVLVLIAAADSSRDVTRGAIACTALAVVSWGIVHAADPNIASALRLLFACIAINVTGALLVSRKTLESARRDVERSRAELEQSRKELENFADSVPQLLWRTDVTGRVDYFNQRYTDLTGHDRFEAVAEQNWGEWFHPDDIGWFAERFAAARETGEDLRALFRMRHADGAYRWMSLAGRPVRSAETGEILRWYGGSTDAHVETLALQELEGLRAELEESRAELLHFMDSVPQILWRADREAKVDRYNRRFSEIIGRDAQEAIDRQDYLEDFHPDDRGWFVEKVRTTFAAGEELQATYRLRHADGTYRWVSLLGRPVFDDEGNLTHYYGGTSDIHDEVMAREELQRTREALEASRVEVENFANSVPYILWRGDAYGNVNFFNQRWEEVTGMPREEALTGRYLEPVHPDDAPGLIETITKAVTTNSVSDAQVRVRQADGSYRWMWLYDRPVISKLTGEIERFGGAADVQHAIEAQEKVREINATLEQRVQERTAELRMTEARYSSLFESSNITFAELDFSGAEGVIDQIREEGVTDLRAHLVERPDRYQACLAGIRTLRINEAMARMVGHESAAVLLEEAIAKGAGECAEVIMRQLEMIFEGKAHIEGRSQVATRDGRDLPVYYTVNRLPGGLHIESYLDLSEQERVEELRGAAQDELARANRIATVGAFSASIAHELNQPIASMLMDVETGLRWLKKEEPDTGSAERVLERVLRTTQRVAAIVKRTRANIIASGRVLEPVDLAALAAETRELLLRDMRRANVVFEVQCDGPVPPVNGDPVDLQQTFVNLVTNAADAMRDQAGTKRVDLSISSEPGGVRIEVSDTGPGIPADSVEQLFQPFFTTKPTGIGMGLQICRTAVEAHGGELTARNRAEGGAVFTFMLPRAVESAET